MRRRGWPLSGLKQKELKPHVEQSMKADGSDLSFCVARSRLAEADVPPSSSCFRAAENVVQAMIVTIVGTCCSAPS